MSSKRVLGIDTSNYTTSIAIVDEESTICDLRKMLQVKTGERGLRQSKAFFQHVENLPILLETAMKTSWCDIGAVAVSSRPRNMPGSYMPVFMSGVSAGRMIASLKEVPIYEFSHQEGHIEAVRPRGWDDFICLQISGGTTELLHYSEGKTEILGGTLDISFGQLIDRIGVYLGSSFPAGGFMDEIGVNNIIAEGNLLSPINLSDGDINLSGIETQCYRFLESGASKEEVVGSLFFRIYRAMYGMIKYAEKKTGTKKSLVVGGVGSSNAIQGLFACEKDVIFPQKNLGKDNAVGVARLGGREIWR